MTRVLFEDRSRAESFGAIAELYDRVRPSYPQALLDALLVERPVRALDVGCGTGIVAALLAQRGCEVLGVDVDARMAAVARSRGIEVEVAAFEEWRSRGRSFELLVSGQAWHWIDPLAGAERAASVLERGGMLGLFWNFGEPPTHVAELLDPIYARFAPGVDDHSVLLGGEDRRAGAAVDGITASGDFEPASVRTFAWGRTYDTRHWLELLQTHSDHQTLPADQRARLLAAVGEAIDSLGGSFELPYRAILVDARRS
ncbi:MAG TPA: methyltransferase domain-containing protein [Solirubrobacteraceae bacterium]|jgi:SAM-dependent methyltransferase|nr:methyltransferase domain-containing protein [Solirubrobacteraceae bacterium]